MKDIIIYQANLEKDIREAAMKSSVVVPSVTNITIDKITYFIEGTKSPEAKAYHTQGMYSEEEVNRIIRRFENNLCQEFKYGDIDRRVKLVNNYINFIKK